METNAEIFTERAHPCGYRVEQSPTNNKTLPQNVEKRAQTRGERLGLSKNLRQERHFDCDLDQAGTAFSLV